MVKALAEAEITELVPDLRRLMFLNSSGIKALCISLVTKADDIGGHRMKILCSDSLTWQLRTIPTFRDLMGNPEIIFGQSHNLNQIPGKHHGG